VLTKRDYQNEKKVKLNSLSYPKVRTFQGESSIGVGMRILRNFDKNGINQQKFMRRALFLD